MHILYLHGFASSPQSSKARFFSIKLAAAGVALHCPDFNHPVFPTLTISRMLHQLDERIGELPEGEIVLIGSSLGGLVAVEAAARAVNRPWHPIVRLILLAPAVELDWERWSDVGPGGVEKWRKEGALEVFHHAYNEPRRLRFSFYEDAAQYAASERRLATPMVIFQGQRDETVEPASVERFARAQPNAVLHMLDDDHRLANSLEPIWQRVSASLIPHP